MPDRASETVAVNQQPEVSSSSSEKTVPSGALILDVRTPQEFSTSKVATATNLPLQDIEKNILPQTAKDEPIYIYCRSGNRSATAKKLLENAGFTNVIDMGGLSDIKKYGLTAS